VTFLFSWCALSCAAAESGKPKDPPPSTGEKESAKESEDLLAFQELKF
jgi:hypothetical protein